MSWKEQYKQDGAVVFDSQELFGDLVSTIDATVLSSIENSSIDEHGRRKAHFMDKETPDWIKQCVKQPGFQYVFSHVFGKSSWLQMVSGIHYPIGTFLPEHTDAGFEDGLNILIHCIKHEGSGATFQVYQNKQITFSYALQPGESLLFNPARTHSISSSENDRYIARFCVSFDCHHNHAIRISPTEANILPRGSVNHLEGLDIAELPVYQEHPLQV